MTGVAHAIAHSHLSKQCHRFSPAADGHLNGRAAPMPSLQVRSPLLYWSALLELICSTGG